MSERTEHTASYWAGFGRELRYLAFGDREAMPLADRSGMFWAGTTHAHEVWIAEERHAWAGSPRPVHPVLDAPMQPNDVNAETVRAYLLALFGATWDGMKKPFGNSGWMFELHEALVTAGLVDGTFDGDEEVGYWLDECDNETADRLIYDAVKTLLDGAR